MSLTPPDNSPPSPQLTPLPAPQPKLFRHLIIPLLLLFALVLGYFYYRKLSSQNSVPSSQSIVFWAPAEDQEFYAPLIEKFQTAHPGVTINYQAEAWPDYRQRLQTAIASGHGPDTFVFHHTWQIMLASLLAPLPATVLSPSDYQALYYPINQNWLKNSAGKYIGVPLSTDGLALFYNTTLLTGAGLNPPATWAQLQETARTLTVRSDNRLLRGGIALGTTNNVDYWSDILGVLLLQNHGDPANPMTAKEADVLTFYTDFTLKDKVWDSTMPPSTYAFANEKAAMMLAPASAVNQVHALNPNLTFGVVPLPPPYKEPLYWGSYWAGGVSRQSASDKQALSWEWLKFLSSKDSLRQFYEVKSQSGLIGPPFPRTDMADQLKSDPYAGAFILEAPNTQSWYLCSHTYDNGVNDKIIAIYEPAVNAVLSGTPPQDALASIPQAINTVLASYSGRR